MKTIYYPNQTRGTANYGWLQANYSFSFANFYDANREQFGKLRVLNDDIIAPGKGFGTHPHSNMEIVSIPLSGALAHQDSLGHESIINTGDIQVMSAGSGIKHSEYNPSKNEATNLLQIWLFPNQPNVTPRYDQKSFNLDDENNKFLTIVAPKGTEKQALWIHQNAYFNTASITANTTVVYKFRSNVNLGYLFVIKGTVIVEAQTLVSKDALGIANTDTISVTASKDARILLIETPN